MTSATHDDRLPTPASAGKPARPVTSRASRQQVWLLAGICALALVLYVWAIGASTFGDAYYSAAAKSMTLSLHNFLLDSYDPYGVLTIDKPPLALWPQAISALIFGFHSWALILPEVIEGVATVFLLHRTVRLWAGEKVALLAALLFALTPISVAINRDNNTDTLLVFWLVASAYALMRSIRADSDRGRTVWVLWCAFFIGCGFESKYLEAWIIVPGFALAYLVSSRSSVWRRIGDLLAGGVVLAVSSFWWPVLHDVWPGTRPYVGSSTDGSAMNLIFGYAGIGRITGAGESYNGSGITNEALNLVGMGGGNSGLSRMFDTVVGGQTSWFLPLALLTLAVMGVIGYRRLLLRIPGGDPVQLGGWILWASWLLVTGVVFSLAQGIWHPYYTSMLTPAIAAISAAGLALLWRMYHEDSGPRWLLLPAAVAVTAAWALVLSSRDTSWYGWTRWIVIAAAVIALIGLLGTRLTMWQGRWISVTALIMGVAAVLFTPTVWSAATAVEHGTNGGFPSAGPPNAAFDALLRGQLSLSAPLPPPLLAFLEHPPPGMSATAPRGGGLGGPDLSPMNRDILDYAVRNSGNAPIKLAVEGGALAASGFIIQSNTTVIGMGGYLGADNAPSVDQLQQWVQQGKLRFVLSAAPGPPRLGGIAATGGAFAAQRVAWVQKNCTVVNPAAYGGTPPNLKEMLPLPSFADEMLFRCGS
jgi:4-amino-4-deoxy-L-arabinose transferase-like glycosyltransferase